MGAMRVIKAMTKAYQHKIPLIPGVLRAYLRVVYSCEVFPSAKIADSVSLEHNGLGCVFHENIEIEDNVTIFQNVTLGGNGKTGEGILQGCNHPHLCKGATIYAGACVLGPIRVGENAIVGANAVVLCDVPDDAVFVGVPAKEASRREVRK